jgi:hypothetical protein
VASLAEPLAVAVRGVSLGRIDDDSRVLVLGAGTIGLLSGLLARERATAGSVAITARHAQQRDAAKRLGLLALAEDEVKPWLREAAPDVVIETVAVTPARCSTPRWCRPGGRIVVLGIFSKRAEVSAYNLARAARAGRLEHVAWAGAAWFARRSGCCRAAPPSSRRCSSLPARTPRGPSAAPGTRRRARSGHRRSRREVGRWSLDAGPTSRRAWPGSWPQLAGACARARACARVLYRGQVRRGAPTGSSATAT